MGGINVSRRDCFNAIGWLATAGNDVVSSITFCDVDVVDVFEFMERLKCGQKNISIPKLIQPVFSGRGISGKNVWNNDEPNARKRYFTFP